MRIALVSLFILLYLVMEIGMIRNLLNINWCLIFMAAFMLAVCGAAFPGSVSFAEWQALASEGMFLYHSMVITFVLYGIFGATLSEGGVVTGITVRALEIGQKRGILFLVLLYYFAGAIASLGGGVFIVIMLGNKLLSGIGFPKKWSAVLSCMPVCATYFLGITAFINIETMTGVSQPQLLPVALVITASAVLTHILTIIILVRRYSLRIDPLVIEAIEEEGGGVRPVGIAYLLPVLPVLLVLAFRWNGAFSFVICTALATVICRIGRPFDLKEIAASAGRAFRKGAVDAADLTGIMICIGVLVQAMNTTSVRDCYVAFMEAVIPDNKWLILVLFFLLGTVGSIYRGIGTPAGMGISIFVAMIALPQYSMFQVAALWLAVSYGSIAIDPLAGSAILASDKAGISSSEYLKAALPVNLLPVLCTLTFVVSYYF